jgi:cell division protein FtsI (penicillin-binding protein 3)
VALFVLSIFAGRLVQLQGLDASALATQALDSRTVKVDLPAHRGDITDIRGAVLATTIERRNITVDQTVVRGYTRQQDAGPKVVVGVQGAASELAPVLGMDRAAVARALTGDRRFAYVAKEVTPDVWREVARLSIPGIYSEQASRRTYPAGDVGSAVLGFVGPDGVAHGGIEGALDVRLAGSNGSLVYEKSRDGRQIPTGLASEVEPVPGDTVRLTLDRDLQWKTQQVLAAQVQSTGAESGTAVIMDPRTGDVLALASVPTFDANDPGRSPAADRGNRALLDVFEPGSTSKVITIAAALEEGTVRPETRLIVDDTIGRGGRTFHDSHSHAPEKLTVAGVLAQSSNVGTIMVGEQLAPRTMGSYLSRFGLGAKTGVGLPESRGILADASDWNGSQRYTVLFGQGLSVTSLQAASVFATIANDGVRVTPRLVTATVAPDGGVTPAPASPSTRVLSGGTAEKMRLMLENVVGDEGTARQAEIPGYRVAGKTGTAQAPDATCGCYRGYTASFIGMAPADDPKLVMAVVLQRPTKGHFGGTVAAPVFRQIMTYALAQRGIPPTGTTPPAIPLTFK